MRSLLPALAVALAWSAFACAPALAQESGEREEPRGPGESDLQATTEAFLMEDGEAIYRGACAGCHQPEGEGAEGAAAYPPLSANPRLQGGHYPVYILINGMGAMPNFNDWLSDEQIVEVVTFIQQNFGNDYSQQPTIEMVAEMRKTAKENAPDSEYGD